MDFVLKPKIDLYTLWGLVLQGFLLWPTNKINRQIFAIFCYKNMIAYGGLGHVLGHFGGFLRRGKQMWIGPIRTSMGPTFWKKNTHSIYANILIYHLDLCT